MTYAIIQTGGKQLRVEPGRFYDVELLPVEQDGTLTLDQVLLVKHDDGLSIGQPLVSNATVEVTSLGNRRGRKVIVYKMKPKKKTRKKRGHRQNYTRILVTSISLEGQVVGEASGSAPVLAAATTNEEE
ncbi:50S ribosomal protein L21 [Leptolyngbya sp. FACHB-261]|uniref:50S ribosomal protein L21 n=1 Tax=Leptolyngbya sp. FACHB-261 TaxID=2692806 RepID=UPI00168909F2|nr:50S ribosomal protein L21 [Leptolyngbya sp. FACHB-261]MBD2104354.1 50S ribosomal protein L21 [Leptolyngbya sp. FACHB-261]